VGRKKKRKRFIASASQITNKMEEITNLDKIPSDIKYYLLGWKDRNMDDYLRKYGDLRLRDLSLEQLHALFSYATTKDGALLARVAS
jgi:hypothetical protein